jgi:threonine dehydrogenase-like Zn-dependent dehydrogenase
MTKQADKFRSYNQIEPLAVAVHSLYTVAQLKTNQNVAVFGAGDLDFFVSRLNPSRHAHIVAFS